MGQYFHVSVRLSSPPSRTQARLHENVVLALLSADIGCDVTIIQPTERFPWNRGLSEPR